MPAPPGLHVIHCAPSQLVASACAHIVGVHESELPDLARPTLVLPILQARQAVARELCQAARAAVLTLPRITTLRHWADEINLPQPVPPLAAREAVLYRALSERG